MKSTPSKITADTITALLADRHAKDVFVPECKDGPTVYGGHLRMDAWALAKSWANPKVTAYEIKIGRGDFLQDDKWPGYLPLCNEFYFVCPAGLIAKDEVPPEVGLLYVSANGGRLFAKKKAQFRNVVVPENVYRYILMFRAKVTRERIDDCRSKQDEWEEWLKQKEYGRELGRKVSKGLQKTIEERIERVEKENRRLIDLHSGYQEVSDFLQRIGLDPNSRWDAQERRVKAKLQVLGGQAEHIATEIERITDRLDCFRKMLTNVMDDCKQDSGSPTPTPPCSPPCRS